MHATIGVHATVVAAALLLDLRIGLFSLRVKAIFFAMITLAVATAFQSWPRRSEGSRAARTA